MTAVLVIKTRKGYAVAPYTGDIPADFVQNMSVATRLDHYTKTDTVLDVLEDTFEPLENVTPIKEAA